jgi:hypothetical protein
VRNGVAAIHKEFRSQRIVLVGGRHLPQSIRLMPEAKGLAIQNASSFDFRMERSIVHWDV